MTELVVDAGCRRAARLARSLVHPCAAILSHLDLVAASLASKGDRAALDDLARARTAARRLAAMVDAILAGDLAERDGARLPYDPVTPWNALIRNGETVLEEVGDLAPTTQEELRDRFTAARNLLWDLDPHHSVAEGRENRVRGSGPATDMVRQADARDVTSRVHGRTARRC